MFKDNSSRVIIVSEHSLNRFNPNIDASLDDITAFCERWNLSEFALFGSVLREDFHEESDVDVMIKFSMVRTPGLFGMVQMAQELEDLFGRKVDLLTRKSVEDSKNYLRRAAILESVQVVYASG